MEMYYVSSPLVFLVCSVAVFWTSGTRLIISTGFSVNGRPSAICVPALTQNYQLFKPYLGSSDKRRHLCGLCVAVIHIWISNTFIHSLSAQYRFTPCSQQGLLPVQANTRHMEDGKKHRKESIFRLQIKKVLDRVELGTWRQGERKKSIQESSVKGKEETNKWQCHFNEISVISATTWFHTWTLMSIHILAQGSRVWPIWSQMYVIYIDRYIYIIFFNIITICFNKSLWKVALT